jgi:hypothetical protein
MAGMIMIGTGPFKGRSRDMVATKFPASREIVFGDGKFGI